MADVAWYVDSGTSDQLDVKYLVNTLALWSHGSMHLYIFVLGRSCGQELFHVLSESLG